MIRLTKTKAASAMALSLFTAGKLTADVALDVPSPTDPDGAAIAALGTSTATSGALTVSEHFNAVLGEAIKDYGTALHGRVAEQKETRSYTIVSSGHTPR